MKRSVQLLLGKVVMREEQENPKLDEDDVFGGINLLTKSLHDLDDRGLILSLAAFSEEALGELLKAFMMPSDATKQLSRRL